MSDDTLAPPSPALAKAVFMRRAAKALLDTMKCDHSNSEYGTCFDCRNTGFLVESGDEEQLVEAALAVLSATNLFGRCPKTAGSACGRNDCPWCGYPGAPHRVVEQLRCELIEARNPGIDQDPHWIDERERRLAACVAWEPL